MQKFAGSKNGQGEVCLSTKVADIQPVALAERPHSSFRATGAPLLLACALLVFVLAHVNLPDVLPCDEPLGPGELRRSVPQHRAEGSRVAPEGPLDEAAELPPDSPGSVAGVLHVEDSVVHSGEVHKGLVPTKTRAGAGSAGWVVGGVTCTGI